MKFGGWKNKWCARVQIKGDIRCVLGEEIYYCLYEVKRPCAKKYYINVTNGKESSTCEFGKDKNAATDAYRKIVEFTVTPCTLRYIAEDFCKLQKRHAE